MVGETLVADGYAVTAVTMKSHLGGLFNLQFPDHFSLLSNPLIEVGGSRSRVGFVLDRGSGGGFLNWSRSRLVVLACGLFVLRLQDEQLLHCCINLVLGTEDKKTVTHFIAIFIIL